jgi:hypothetical protein
VFEWPFYWETVHNVHSSKSTYCLPSLFSIVVARTVPSARIRPLVYLCHRILIDRSHPRCHYQEPHHLFSSPSLLIMTSQASPSPANVAARPPDRETPFSPFYSGIDISITTSQASLQSQASLPSLSSTARCQHHFRLSNGKDNNDQPWLSLYMTSRSPKPNYLPMFIGEDEISGYVELELTKPENIREVIIAVCPVHYAHVAIVS